MPLMSFDVFLCTMCCPSQSFNHFILVVLPFFAILLSGADIRSLCQEASMGPVREVAVQSQGNLSSINANTMPAISLLHFEGALDSVLPSVSSADLHRYVEWNNLYGSFRRMV